uniref:E3 SUMO-protein ligase KIAA1586-like n=1 Tax=Pelusios castaneus TaxID=367368 RepID=A0A8C8RZV8_9SAUR
MFYWKMIKAYRSGAQKRKLRQLAEKKEWTLLEKIPRFSDFFGHKAGYRQPALEGSTGGTLPPTLAQELPTEEGKYKIRIVDEQTIKHASLSQLDALAVDTGIGSTGKNAAATTIVNNSIDENLDAVHATLNTLPWPECWTTEQYIKFKKDNNWLFVASGKLGCIVCRDVANMGHAKLSGCKMTLSDPWVGGAIRPYGVTKSAQQTSLRKKIHDHRTSNAHNAAAKVLDDQKAHAPKCALHTQVKQQHAGMCKIFRTAYYIAQNDRPYSDHPDLITLQQLNGVDTGRVLHPSVACADIIDHISVEMKRSLCSSIIPQQYQISVLIDESTSLSKLSCLVIYLRTTFDVHVGPVTFFLDLVELGSNDADGVVLALLQCLTAHGFTEEFLKDNWIGIGVDGTSVMLGRKAGVAAKLKTRFPRLISWHCFNHRLELAVADAIKCCSEVNHFKSFVDSMYALYSQSPKCLRELAECASDLEVQLNRIGRVLDVRWVASSCRTVRAVWRSYAALHSHFLKKSTDFSLEGKNKAKFAGMAKNLENPVFVKNLGLMLDALEDLADLSLVLQKSDVTLSTASKLIRRQVQVFIARRECDSEFYREACEAIASGCFKGVRVNMSVNAGKQIEISKCQFYQALVDCMYDRLLPDSEKQLSRAVEALDPSRFTTELSPEFGESDIEFLCSEFGIAFNEVKFAYREYKDSQGAVMKPALQKLVNCVNTIPVSTAECERGFSKMNIICNCLQPGLTVKHMSSLMFISLCGPPFPLWEPLKYVKSWLLLNQGPAASTQGPSRKTGLQDEGATMKSMWQIMEKIN